MAQPRPSLPRAKGPGLIRNITLGIWQEVLTQPISAGAILRRRLRRARSLGSKGRRIATSVLYGMIRQGAALDLLLELGGGSAQEPLHCYLGFLVLAEGLEPRQAQAEAPEVDFSPVAHAERELRRWGASVSPVEALTLAGSLPPWLAQAWHDELGDEAGLLIKAFSSRPPMVARINASRVDRRTLVQRLEQEGVIATAGRLSPLALIFHERRNVHILPTFKEGLFEIQDEGSQLIAQLVQPAPGKRIVDFCAGAGGKALALADAGAEVWALDVRKGVSRVLQQRARRAGLRIRYDHLKEDRPPPVPRGWADAVLVDAPCSSSGVLRRHPEQRFRLTGSWVAHCAALQRAILERAAGLLGPGGQLIYATCSLLRQENQDVLEGFLADHPSFELQDRLGEDGQLWPQRTGTDGFYGVTLRHR